MLSLSATALDRGEGIWHYVKHVEGPAMFRTPGTQNSWEADPDAVEVETVCGKGISAYPETQQTHLRPCVRCTTSRAEPACWSRIIPPVNDCEKRWVQYYWRDHGGMFTL